MKKQAEIFLDYATAERGDGELVRGCLEGRAECWEILIERYQRLIYSIPIKARMSEDDAADIFQTVCLKLYEGLPRLRDHDRLVAWLVTTTRRECWRAGSRRRREGQSQARDDQHYDETADVADPRPLTEETFIEIERQQMVRSAIDSLPERCRRLLDMLFYRNDELSYLDISREMNMPVSSIGPTRARCLENLKKKLKGRI
jgi:RNA polymerase sigma factor (sigma-70 family)